MASLQSAAVGFIISVLEDGTSWQTDQEGYLEGYGIMPDWEDEEYSVMASEFTDIVNDMVSRVKEFTKTFEKEN